MWGGISSDPPGSICSFVEGPRPSMDGLAAGVAEDSVARDTSRILLYGRPGVLLTLDFRLAVGTPSKLYCKYVSKIFWTQKIVLQVIYTNLLKTQKNNIYIFWNTKFCRKNKKETKQILDIFFDKFGEQKIGNKFQIKILFK